MKQTLDQLMAQPLRTELQAKCALLPPRYKGWHSFEVRKVYYSTYTATSYALKDYQGPPSPKPDAFGVYGTGPAEGLQYFISDCVSLANAETLKQALELRA